MKLTKQFYFTVWPKMSVLLIKTRHRLNYLSNDGSTTDDDTWRAGVKKCGWELIMDARTAETRIKNMVDAYKAIIVEEGRCDEAGEVVNQRHLPNMGKRADILEWLPAMHDLKVKPGN